MAKTTARTGTAPFAHLLTLVTGRGAKRAEEERDDETIDDDDDDGAVDPDEVIEEADELDDAADPEDPDEKKGKTKSKKAKRAKKAEGDEGEDDDDDRDAEDEKLAEDDDDDEEMARARREGFLAAQARGRRIFSAATASARPDMAAHLAFNDTMSSKRAISMLNMAAGGSLPSSGSRLHRRMARVVIPNPGAGGDAKKPGEMSFGEMAKAAGKKAGIF